MRIREILKGISSISKMNIEQKNVHIQIETDSKPKTSK